MTNTQQSAGRLTSEILDRLPPQNLDAEKALLGSILCDSRVVDDVSVILHAEDFYADANQKLYHHLLTMHAAAKPIDAMLLVEQLKQAGDFEAVGGAAYLAEVAQSVPYAANAVYYARIVREKATLRDLIHAGTEILRDAYDTILTPEEIVTSAESKISAITTGDYSAKPKAIRDAVVEALDRIEAIRERQQHIGLLTGLESLDSLGGLFGGELFVLAARPGVGKTAMGCQIAEYVSGRGKLVLLCSLEMSAVEITTRIICSQSGVSSMRIRRGEIDDSDYSPLAAAGNSLGNHALVIDDRPSMTVNDIRREARRLSRQGLSLVIVDYLQRLTPLDRKVQRHEQVGQMTDCLKTLARELNIPVLCLCQLNRASEKEDRPGLHHLRESGSIEQDADVVGILHRNVSGYRDAENDRAAELLIAKNRNGETGAFLLTWQPERTRFVPRYESNYTSPKPPNYNQEFAAFEQ
jgi:replicative DNA helicase